MDSVNSGGFWDGLKSVGLQTFNTLLTPASAGISKTFQNLVLGAQGKVADATNKIVSSTDPRRNAASPAIPPTTGSSANPALNPSTSLSMGVIAAALGIIFVVWYLSRGK